MDWWQLVFALIVITGYVVKHILAVQQEQQQRKQSVPPRVRELPKPAPVARTDDEATLARTELDARVDEAKQRRRELQDMPEAASLPLPKRTLPMPLPRPPLPRYQPRPEPAVDLARFSSPQRPSLPAPPQPSANVAPAAPSRPEVLTLPAVLQLLRNRQSLAVAIVLREILAPPVSSRRRG